MRLGRDRPAVLIIKPWGHSWRVYYVRTCRKSYGDIALLTMFCAYVLTIWVGI